jgi:hypothetical protein
MKARRHNSTFALGRVSCSKDSFVVKVPPFGTLRIAKSLTTIMTRPKKGLAIKVNLKHYAQREV